MSKWVERSFDLVADITKQVLTLSAGIVALSVTFLTYLAGETATSRVTCLLIISWGLFALAIIAGMWTLMALAGTQQKAGSQKEDSPDIYQNNIKLPGLVQLGSFALGVVLLLIAGAMQL